MISRVTFVLTTALIACSSHPAVAQAPELQPFGLSTAAGIDQNLAALSDVEEREAPNYERLVSGKTVNEGAFVLLGANGGPLEYLGVTMDGSFEGDELDDLAVLEKQYGLDASQRSIGSCGVLSKGDCVAVFYGCPDAPPTCHVTLISYKVMGIEETALTWMREATDLTTRH